MFTMSLKWTNPFIFVTSIVINAIVFTPNVLSHNYNVGLLMVYKSATNRFDLVHIGPAIEIAIQVRFVLLSFTYHFTIELVQ